MLASGINAVSGGPYGTIAMILVRSLMEFRKHNPELADRMSGGWGADVTRTLAKVADPTAWSSDVSKKLTGERGGFLGKALNSMGIGPKDDSRDEYIFDKLPATMAHAVGWGPWSSKRGQGDGGKAKPQVGPEVYAAALQMLGAGRDDVSPLDWYLGGGQ